MAKQDVHNQSAPLSNQAYLSGEGARDESMMQTEAGLWPAQPTSTEAVKQAAARKNRYYALLYREMADRRRAEGQLRVNYGLLSTLSHAQLRFLSGAELTVVFEDLLEPLIDVTASTYGFIAEAELQDDEANAHPIYSATTLARVLPEAADSVADVLDELGESVLGNSQNGRPLMSSCSFAASADLGMDGNEAITDLLGAYSFLGLPLYAGDRSVGILALGGRADGYDEDIVELLQPVQAACTQMILAKRADERRREAETALVEERASLAERVTESTAELRKVNDELQYAVRAKDEFLAMVNHELRTPLNAMLLLTEVLFKGIYGDLNEKQLRSVRDISESGRHLLSLITDILDVSKMEAGKLELDLGPCDVRSVCKGSVQLVQGMADKNNLRIDVDIEESVQTIRADSRRLKQMLVNLLSNAVKFTPAGGSIGLEVKGDKISEEVRFTVWDTGIGIAKEDIEKLFQPFVQIDSGHTRQYGGSGLGLVLVANMAKMHGGKVTVESEIDSGSSFVISLPWKEEDEEDDGLELLGLSRFRSAQPGHRRPSTNIGRRRPALSDSEPLFPSSTTNESSVTNGTTSVRNNGSSEPQPISATVDRPQTKRPPTILIVDDNAPNVDALAEYLCIHDCELAVAHDGLDAIRKASELQPSLILMDVQMPEMDGIEATRRIREIPELANSAIVGLTASVMPGNQERCLAAGMTDFLGKPVDLDSLDRVIYQYAGIGPQSAEHQSPQVNLLPGDD